MLYFEIQRLKFKLLKKKKKKKFHGFFFRWRTCFVGNHLA